MLLASRISSGLEISYIIAAGNRGVFQSTLKTIPLPDRFASPAVPCAPIKCLQTLTASGARHIIEGPGSKS
jgi:hypothetical protein